MVDCGLGSPLGAKLVEELEMACNNVCGSLNTVQGCAHKMPKKRPDRELLYGLAERQAGYFTARQGAEAGFSWDLLPHSSKAGRFQRVAHSIYRLSRFPPSRFEDLFVAWLRGGPRTVISHAVVLFSSVVSPYLKLAGSLIWARAPLMPWRAGVTLRTSGGCVEACLTDRVRVLWDLS